MERQRGRGDLVEVRLRERRRARELQRRLVHGRETVQTEGGRGGGRGVRPVRRHADREGDPAVRAGDGGRPRESAGLQGLRRAVHRQREGFHLARDGGRPQIHAHRVARRGRELTGDLAVPAVRRARKSERAAGHGLRTVHNRPVVACREVPIRDNVLNRERRPQPELRSGITRIGVLCARRVVHRIDDVAGVQLLPHCLCEFGLRHRPVQDRARLRRFCGRKHLFESRLEIRRREARRGHRQVRSVIRTLQLVDERVEGGLCLVV